jgi:acyl-CoA thioesterase-1
MVLAAAASLAASTARAAAPKRVVILGDSITAGLGLPGADALPNQLHLAVERLGVPNVVRGAAVSGDTTADGLGRLDFSVHAGAAVAVVALGGNDLLRGLDPRVTKANLTEIVRRLKQRGMVVILTGMKAPPQIGEAYARDFNAVFPEVAQAEGAIYYPDWLAGVSMNPKLKQPDGIHPNAEGVRKIVAGLAPVVAKALRTAPTP